MPVKRPAAGSFTEGLHMPQQPIQLAVIIGSTRHGRLGPTVARWFVGRARQRDDVAVDLIDLADFPLPTSPSGEAAAEAALMLRRLSTRLAGADAFVVVTPEYNHSFPAALKTVIDWHVAEWRAKPVGFVSYGGVSGGLLAVEQLRGVFAELHAVTIRDTVCFHGAWDAFDADGEPKQPARFEAAATTMVDRLAWWSRALGAARTASPYAA